MANAKLKRQFFMKRIILFFLMILAFCHQKTAESTPGQEKTLLVSKKIQDQTINFFETRAISPDTHDMARAILVERPEPRQSLLLFIYYGDIRDFFNIQDNIFFYVSQGSGSYPEFYRIYLKDNQLKSEGLSFKNDRGFDYSGHDTFKYENNILYRTVPIYNESDANCCPKGGKIIYEYTYTKNAFREVKRSIVKP